MRRTVSEHEVYSGMKIWGLVQVIRLRQKNSVQFTPSLLKVLDYPLSKRCVCTLCSKHSISITPSSTIRKLSRFTRELMRKLCYPINFDAIASAIVVFAISHCKVSDFWRVVKPPALRFCRCRTSCAVQAERVPIFRVTLPQQSMNRHDGMPR